MVVDALGHGEQIVILRKGGIPTRFHQQCEGVIESARGRFEKLQWSAEDVLKIEFGAEVVEGRQLDSLDQAKRLAGQHIWREEVIADRFDWGREQGIYAMAVRMQRLPKPMELPLPRDEMIFPVRKTRHRRQTGC